MASKARSSIRTVYASMYRGLTRAPTPIPSASTTLYRAPFRGVGSDRGHAPLCCRSFAGDQFVRGLRAGELGPVGVTVHAAPSGTIVPSPSYAGANLITAASAEYRAPLRNGVQDTAFC